MVQQLLLEGKGMVERARCAMEMVPNSVHHSVTLADITDACLMCHDRQYDMFLVRVAKSVCVSNWPILMIHSSSGRAFASVVMET